MSWNIIKINIKYENTHMCILFPAVLYCFIAFFIWPLWHYSHFDTGTSASAKHFLPLFSFALAGLLFQFEVQTTDMKSLNLISCIGIHTRISSIIYAYKNQKCYFSFSIQKICIGARGHFRNFCVGMCRWDPGTLDLYQS